MGYVIGIWRNDKALIKQNQDRKELISSDTYTFLGWTKVFGKLPKRHVQIRTLDLEISNCKLCLL